MTRTPRDVIAKLRGRSRAELSWRGRQLARVWLERVGLSSYMSEPSDAEFLARLTPSARVGAATNDFQGFLEDWRRTSRFFAGVADRDATVRCHVSRWPDATPSIIARADAFAAGRFDLLGYEGLRFGHPIDWHRDPIAGRTAPTAHWSRVAYLDPSVVGDHKVIWELNRHQYFLTLGRAYWLTGNESYAKVIVDHLTSWVDANPPKTGMNWASSLEVSFRAISWLWALHFLRDSSSLTPRLFRRLVGVLDLHGRQIADNLSTYFSPNTHLTGEALGLVAVGTALPQLQNAEEWRKIGYGILEAEFFKQIRPDGTYVEQSLYYHRYTLDIFMQALVLSRHDGNRLRVIEERLQAAFDHAMYLTRPDGTFPLIGDDDGGELLPLDARATNDFRAGLGTAAALFGRADYACAAGELCEETLWLLGPSGVTAFDALRPVPPVNTSRGFADGGYYVMRDTWSRDANWLAMDAGPHGYLNCGHAHADALSIDVVSRGRSLLTDAGTFSYSADLESRNHFRSTAAHNTVVVDGHSSSQLGAGAFHWKGFARTEVRRWISTSSFDFIAARHDGFTHLESPVFHERSVLFVRGEYWLIRDRIESAGDHDVEVLFHCAPGIVARQLSENSVSLGEADASDGQLTLLMTLAPGGSYNIVGDSMSPRYGKRVDTTSCIFRLRARGTQDIVTFVIPFEGAVPRVESDITSNIYHVAVDGSDDLLCLHASGGSIESDAAIAWVRRDPTTGAAAQWFFIDGSRLRVDGNDLAQLDRPTDYLESDSRAMTGTPQAED
jgi:hypothetical protein